MAQQFKTADAQVKSMQPKIAIQNPQTSENWMTRQPKLHSSDANNIKNGNRYAFAYSLLKEHPDFAEKVGFDLGKAQNKYDQIVDFDKDIGRYTFYADDGTRYYFDTDLKYMGLKF